MGQSCQCNLRKTGARLPGGGNTGAPRPRQAWLCRLQASQASGRPARQALQITSWPDEEFGIHVAGEPFNTYQEKGGETSALGFRKMSLA